MRKQLTFTLACWLCLNAVSAAAEWSSDAEVNNLVTDSAAQQSDPSIVSDGAGNFFLVWVERVENVQTVRVQRVDSEGIATWTAGGMELLVNSSQAIYPSVFSDGAGGCVATVRTDFMFVDAQRYDSEGDPLWGDSLVRMLDEYGANGFWLLPAGDDGFFFGSPNEGLLRWVSADGQTLSELVEFEEALYPLVAAAPDGSDGVVIAWVSNGSLMVQRFDSEGLAMWSEGDPVVLASVDYISSPRVLVADESVLVGWIQEDSEGQAMAFVQKLDLEGNVLWAADGVEASVGAAGSFRMVPDASGGVWVVWKDDDTDALFARPLNAHGAAAWSEPAQIVSEADELAAVTDGLGGVVVAWTDAEATAVLAQRLTVRNPAAFGSSGLVLSEPGGSALGHNDLDLTWNGLSGFVAIWSDRRDEAGRVYLQGFSVDGKLGRPGTAPAGSSSGGGGCAATAGSTGPMAIMLLISITMILLATRRCMSGSGI